MDVNYLGTFSSIESVWNRYPDGGVEGDFLHIDGVKYSWNKYDKIWESRGTETYFPSRPEEMSCSQSCCVHRCPPLSRPAMNLRYAATEDDLPRCPHDTDWPHMTEEMLSGIGWVLSTGRLYMWAHGKGNKVSGLYQDLGKISNGIYDPEPEVEKVEYINISGELEYTKAGCGTIEEVEDGVLMEAYPRVAIIATKKTTYTDGSVEEDEIVFDHNYYDAETGEYVEVSDEELSYLEGLSYEIVGEAIAEDAEMDERYVVSAPAILVNAEDRELMTSSLNIIVPNNEDTYEEVTCTVFQEACPHDATGEEDDYDSETATLAYTGNAPAAGGNTNAPALSYSQRKISHYRDGDEYTTITSGATSIIYSLGAAPEGTTINSGTGVVTFGENTQTTLRNATINVSVTLNGKQISAQAEAHQAGKVLNMYYGKMNISGYSAAGGITIDAVESSESMTESSVHSLGKTGIELTEGESSVILIPSSSNLVAKKDDGFGGKVIFDSSISGANGTSINFGGYPYKVYGELCLATIEQFIYVE